MNALYSFFIQDTLKKDYLISVAQVGHSEHKLTSFARLSGIIHY